MPRMPDEGDFSIGDGKDDEKVLMKIQPVLFDHSTNFSNNSIMSVDNKTSNDEDKQAEKMMTPSFK